MARLVRWDLTALLTQIRSYRAFKLEDGKMRRQTIKAIHSNCF